MAEKNDIHVTQAGEQITNPVIGAGDIGLSKITTTVAEDIGRIKDPNVARELADIEATQGRDAALAREKELQRQAETGLTPEERRNVGVIEFAKNEYPDAVNIIIDSKGREVAVLQPPKKGETGYVWLRVLTHEGPFSINMEPLGGAENYKKLDWNEFISKVKDARARITRFNSEFEMTLDKNTVPDEMARKTATRDYVRVVPLDIVNPKQLEILKMDLKEAEVRGRAAKEEYKNTEKEQSLESILNQLKR